MFACLYLWLIPKRTRGTGLKNIFLQQVPLGFLPASSFIALGQQKTGPSFLINHQVSTSGQNQGEKQAEEEGNLGSQAYVAGALWATLVQTPWLWTRVWICGGQSALEKIRRPKLTFSQLPLNLGFILPDQNDFQMLFPDLVSSFCPKNVNTTELLFNPNKLS